MYFICICFFTGSHFVSSVYFWDNGFRIGGLSIFCSQDSGDKTPTIIYWQHLFLVNVYFYFAERLAMQPNSIIGSRAICVTPWSLQVHVCWGFYFNLIIEGVTKQTTKGGSLFKPQGLPLATIAFSQRTGGWTFRAMRNKSA